MKATSKCGHEWTGETEIDGGSTWYNYRDENGKEYQSREIPAYRIDMRGFTQITTPSGKRAIAPLTNY